MRKTLQTWYSRTFFSARAAAFPALPGVEVTVKSKSSGKVF